MEVTVGVTQQEDNRVETFSEELKTEELKKEHLVTGMPAAWQPREQKLTGDQSLGSSRDVDVFGDAISVKKYEQKF